MPKVPTTDAAAAGSAIIAALKKRPGSSAAEIAERLGRGRSTATKKLADLEKAGLAVRTPGKRDGGVRTPDQWNLMPKVSTSSAMTSRKSSPTATATRPKGNRSPSNRKSSAATDRLPRGELAKLVREYLDTHPGAHSPTAIASDLQRSAGAVANALVRLVDETEAILIQVAPKRYAAR